MDQFLCMGISKTSLPLLFIILITSGCGSDVPPGEIEGAPRSSESIYEQDLRFLENSK